VSDDNKKAPEIRDAEIEQEIRAQRKFSIAEAIGRSAGDLMKGASPITRKQQAEFVIEQLIESFLNDEEGALAPELLRRVKASEALLESYDDPRAALAQVTRDLLDSDDSLRRFVIRVDAQWGRIYLERPHFERDGRAPHRDDPYTRDSVRATLAAFLAEIETDANRQG
jgi:hypothetical protein